MTLPLLSTAATESCRHHHMCVCASRAAQDKGEFSQAFWLCAQSCQWMSELGQLQAAKLLSASVNLLYEETTQWLESALQSLCADFKADKVSKVGGRAGRRLASVACVCVWGEGGGGMGGRCGDAGASRC